MPGITVETQGKTHKQLSLVDYYPWTHQCWPSYIVFEHWMQSQGLR